MKREKILCTTAILGLILLASGCNNFFHELVPPDENRITSFWVSGQLDAAIGDNVITLTVEKGTDMHAVIPQISVSSKASLLPLALDYVRAAFPQANILAEAMAIYATPDPSQYVMDLIKRNPGFNVPALNMPIDFSGPVNFLVISGQGTIRQYKVRVAEDTGAGKILGFGFSKYNNPELVRDGFSMVNETSKTIMVSISYPAEMSLSYSLVPSFEILGDSLEVDGTVIRSGQDAVQFNQTPGLQTKTVTVYRDGEATDYTLTVYFAEDPDTIRSIIDFRFTTADNPGIAATAVASIVNNENLGTIRVQVFYNGAMPGDLVPRFVSPGTVSVTGTNQTSGSSRQNFSSPVEYLVISRNGQYRRVYTVQTEFINIAGASPRISSFRFAQTANTALIQDTVGQISDGSGLILIDAHYGGYTAPASLVPQFSATGTVTVAGSVQTSGMSAQNFERQIKYTVMDPVNPLLKRDYWVQVRFVQDTSSHAIINSFSFHPDENSLPMGELSAAINQAAGTINIYAPVGSGVTSRTMYPRFSAAGQVSVAGAVQSSGDSGQLFNAPVVYTVVSANGFNRKDYTVNVRELKSTIYVKSDAVWGHNDGTSWYNAFISLQSACEAAALFPDDMSKEIWIARGTYRPSETGDRDAYFALTPNTSYIGGFAGYETDKSQRSPASSPVVISGDLGVGKKSRKLFANAESSPGNPVLLTGNIVFESLTFTGSAGPVIDARGSGVEIIHAVVQNSAGDALSLDGGNSGNITISDLVMDNITGRGINLTGAVYVKADGITITNTTAGAWNQTGGNTEIKNITVTNTAITSGNYGIQYSGSGSVAINKADIQNVNGANGAGIYVSTSGAVQITGNSRINKANASNGALYIANSAAVTLTDLAIDDVTGMGIYMSPNASSLTQASRITIQNTTTGAWYHSRGDVNVNGLTVDNPTMRDGNYGFQYSGAGSVVINKADIQHVKGSNGGGIYVSTSDAVTITNSTIQNTEAGNYGGGIYIYGGTLQMTNTTVKNTKAASFGGGICLQYSRGAFISNSVIDATTTGIDGGGIYFFAYNDQPQYSLEITGTTQIKNCTASSCGGGISLGSGKLQIRDNAVISGNKALQGGGIDFQYGSFAMSGGTISNNVARSGGGGIVIYGSSFTVSGGTISNNAADRDGGGILAYVNINSNLPLLFEKNGGVISGNTASRGATMFILVYDSNLDPNLSNYTVGSIAKNSPSPAGDILYANSAPPTFTGNWD